MLSPGEEPLPEELTIGQALGDYENVGKFISVIGEVILIDGGNFYIEGDPGDIIQVYIDFDTGISIADVDLGDEYKVVSPCVLFDLDPLEDPPPEVELKPRYQGDLVEDPYGDTVPVIRNVSVSNWKPMASDPVTVTATITDNGRSVASATLYYRDSDGETGEPWQNVAMTNTSGDEYSGTIPGGHTGVQLDYYIEAIDGSAQSTPAPYDAPDYPYELGVGITSIYDMQYVHQDSSSQWSPYAGRPLNIEGVVTAGYLETGFTTRFVLQEEETGPYGGYRFGGVLVYRSGYNGEMYRGDLVQVGGEGYEFYNLTELLAHHVDAIEVVDYGVDLPSPERASTRVLRDNTLDDGNSVFGEAYESVWIKTFPSLVLEDQNEFGEYPISSTGLVDDSIPVDPWIDLSYVGTLGDVITVEGFMNYAYGVFEIVPVADEYIILTDFPPVPDDMPTVENAGGFRAIAPNPFNPKTTISFVVNHDNLAQLNVYNIRGEKVRTLIHGRLTADTYDITWDGTDDAGQTLSSGQYFARLRIGAEVMQVRKMMLVE